MLKILDDIKDLSYLFFGRTSLLSLPDFFELKTNGVTKMNHLFMKCDLCLYYLIFLNG